MSNPNEKISVSQWLALLSPDGQQQIIDFVVEARETRGAAWIAEIQAEFPMFSWIVDLAANRTADDALAEIERAYPHIPVRMIAGGQIKTLHGRLRAEIDKKR